MSYDVESVVAIMNEISKVYGTWDYLKTETPKSIPGLINYFGSTIKNSKIDSVSLGSRRWAEYVSLHEVDYDVTYDHQVNRDDILFFEDKTQVGKLKVENLPEDNQVPI